MRLATILLVLTSGACVGPETATRPTDPQPQPALALSIVIPQVGFGGIGIDIRGPGFATGATVSVGDPATNVHVINQVVGFPR